MTDYSSSRTEPSMDDILASIRRIIDEDTPDVTKKDSQSMESFDAFVDKSVDNFARPPALPTVSNVEIDDDAVAEALAEYDSAVGSDADAVVSDADLDPEEETIFPERGGALWRRIAGHTPTRPPVYPFPTSSTKETAETSVESDAPDGLADVEVVEKIVETAELPPSVSGDAGGDDGELQEIDRLLESAVASYDTPDLDALDILTDEVRAPSAEQGSAVELTPIPEMGVGAMTAAGLGAAGVLAGTSAESLLPGHGDTHTNDSEARYRHGEDFPAPIFERVTATDDGAIAEDEKRFEQTTFGADPVIPSDDAPLDLILEQSSDEVPEYDIEANYANTLRGDDLETSDDLERVLDESFYDTRDYQDAPPESQDSYAAVLGADLNQPRRMDAEAAAPETDELDTVGGLVRDALRSRMPLDPATVRPDAEALMDEQATDTAARSLASLARYDTRPHRRIYGGIRITDDVDSPTIEEIVQDTLRPMLRDWLNENLPTLVEGMVKQEVERISARSRHFIRRDDE